MLFINAVDEVTRERAQSFLEREHIKKIVEAYGAFENVLGFARLATLEEIRTNQANLSVQFYVRPAENVNGIGVQGRHLAEMISEWETSSRTLRTSMAALFVTLEKAGMGK